MTRLDGSDDRCRDRGFPVPWQEFMEAFVGMIVNAGEGEPCTANGEPGFLVSGVELGGS